MIVRLPIVAARVRWQRIIPVEVTKWCLRDNPWLRRLVRGLTGAP